MGEVLEKGGNIRCYGEVDVVVGVVPTEVKAAELRAGPVSGCFMVELKGGEEVIGVIMMEIFYTEIIDAKTKHNFACSLAPETNCVRQGVVAMGG